MQEILPGVFHWTTFHEGIGEDVHSYYVAATDPAIVIDPRVPEEGLDWFEGRAAPRHILLTNRLHYRHSDRFSAAFGATVWCHATGLYHFPPSRPVSGFQHGALLPGGITALEVDVLCPEETTYYLPLHGGILAIGDAIIRLDDALGFVPDELMGEDPAAVKQGLHAAYVRHLARDFDHLLFAHGAPWIGQGKAALAGFLAVVESESLVASD